MKDYLLAVLGPPVLIGHAGERKAERRATLEGKFVYLGGIFHGVKEPIYADLWGHLRPEGNEIVADAMARHIERDLNGSAPNL